MFPFRYPNAHFSQCRGWFLWLFCLLIISCQPLQQKFELSDFYTQSPELGQKVETVFATLTDEERVAQMIMIAAGDAGLQDSVVCKIIENNKIGGVVILNGSVQQFKHRVQLFKQSAVKANALPLIFAADAEPSLFNKKITGLPLVPQSYQITDTGVSRAVAAQIAHILKDIGIHINFAPVCDFTAAKSVTEYRSFGKNETNVSNMACSFIQQTQHDGIVATAKHFPGHGSAGGDSHQKIVTINGEIHEINVFKKTVANKVIALMVGHIAVANNELYDTQGEPASLSPKLIQNIVRNEWNFDGLVISDGMNMGAVKDLPRPSYRAIVAGCDIVLFPSSEDKLIKTLVSEMSKNKKLQNQIYTSVKRILRLKICLGLV